MTREEIYHTFEELDKQASMGGGIDRIEKQHASGRMTARERIDMLLDKGTFNPPAQGPRMADSWGMTPEAMVFW